MKFWRILDWSLIWNSEKDKRKKIAGSELLYHEKKVRTANVSDDKKRYQTDGV